ncbi:hypothetical protein HK104_007179 [Borealophlyctis nickersoniae]|nr:hypothetical protein HK104_007179 [Borealophlyctis nickersoniae]
MVKVKVKTEPIDKPVATRLRSNNETKTEDETKIKIKVETLDDGSTKTVVDFEQYGFEDAKREDYPDDNFLNTVYSAVLGGSHQDTFPRPGRKTTWKYGDGQSYVRAKTTWNPQLPSCPGAHGVIFVEDAGTTYINQSEVQVAVSHKKSTPGFRYCGRYRVTGRGYLTPEEFSKLSFRTIETWLTEMEETLWGAKWLQTAGLDENADEDDILAAELYELLKEEDTRQRASKLEAKELAEEEAQKLAKEEAKKLEEQQKKTRSRTTKKRGITKVEVDEEEEEKGRGWETKRRKRGQGRC